MMKFYFVGDRNAIGLLLDDKGSFYYFPDNLRINSVRNPEEWKDRWKHFEWL